MKKESRENSLFVMFVKELIIYAAEIILVIGVLAGVLFAVSWISELLSGIMDLGTGMLLLFTIAGVTLYLDFRPEKGQFRGRTHVRRRKRDARPSTCKLLSAYPTRQAG